MSDARQSRDGVELALNKWMVVLKGDGFPPPSPVECAAFRDGYKSAGSEMADTLPDDPTEEIIDAMVEGYQSWADQQAENVRLSKGENMANVYRALVKHLRHER